MILCAAGDIHGALDRLYEAVLAFENSLGVQFEWVLHVGDFGVWPDPDRVDRATRRHGDAGDFPVWCAEGRAAPRPTLFIKGNHEDFDWLEAQARREILPNLTYLRNGETFDAGGVTIGGVGGCHGPSSYGRRSRDLQGRARRHYTREDVDRLIGAGRVDVLLTHDAPAGVVFPRHRMGANWASNAAGLDDLVRAVRPQVCFFGHHHIRVDGDIEGVPCLGLNLVGRPGNLVALRIEGRRWTLLGEWPTDSPGRTLRGLNPGAGERSG